MDYHSAIATVLGKQPLSNGELLEKLRKSERLLAEAQSLAQVGSWEWDVVNNRSIWSDELYRLFGLEPQQMYITEETYFSLIHPEDVERVRSITRRVVGENCSFNYESRRILPDGSIRYLEDRGLAFADESGKTVRMVGICQDITERKRTEAALRTSESRFRAIVDAIPDLMVQVRRDGTIVDFGSEKAEKLRMMPEQFIGMSVFDILPAQVAKQAVELVGQTLDTGDLNVLEYYIPVNQKQLDFEARLVFSAPEEALAIIRNVSEHKQAEQALRESEESYRTITETASDAIITIDENSFILLANEATTRIFGYSAEELTGESLTKLMPEYLRYAHQAGLNKYVATGEKHTAWTGIELPGLHKQGHEIPLEVSFAESMRNGKRIFTGMARDITERKHAAEALSSSEERFRQAFELAGIGMALVSLDGKWIQVNQALCEIVGYSEAELLTKTYQDITHVDDQRLDREMLPILLAGEVSSTQFEKRYIHKNGHLVWVLLSISLVKDRSDAPIHFIAQVQDITESKQAQDNLTRAKEDLERRVIERTAAVNISNGLLQLELSERKQAEEKLQSSEARYRAVVEDQTEFISRYLPDGTFTFVNEAHCAFWLRTREELIGTSFLNFLPPDWRVQTEQHLASFNREKPVAQRDQKVVNTDGSVRWVHWVDRALFDDMDNVIEYQSVGVDVTERVLAMEAAEAANRAKSEFLSRMSHELRTPLNAILGFGELLELSIYKPRDLANLSFILQAGRHLLQLINEVLDIAQVESGKIPLSLEAVSISRLVQECVELVRPLAVPSKIRLTISDSLRDLTPGGHKSYVQADQQRLKQVLLNLLGNAIKYNRQGGSVEVSCEEVDGEPGENKPRLVLKVSDTGPGIADNLIDRLFTPFDRLGAEKTNVEGTGLGLTLSRRLVEAMGGTVGATSRPNEGSTFWVNLPGVDEPPHQIQDIECDNSLPDNEPRHERTLLYIEDNLSNLKLVEGIVALVPNMRVMAAMQGQIGIEMAREHQPDIILLDLQLPDIDGDEVLRILLENPVTRSIPVFMLSADATPRQIQRLLTAGARGYITKPLNVKEFLQVLNEALI